MPRFPHKQYHNYPAISKFLRRFYPFFCLFSFWDFYVVFQSQGKRPLAAFGGFL
jgi:hypothetical protein